MSVHRRAEPPGALDALAQTWTDPTAPWEMQRVWNRLGDLRNQTVLLLGNGESYNELYLLTQEPQALIYSDLSPVGLRELRRHVDAARHGNLVFAAIDAMDLPLRDGSVDLVYGFAFAHHLPDVERFLGEVARVLRPRRPVRVDGQRIFAALAAPQAPLASAAHAAESSQGAALARGRPRDDGGRISRGATGGSYP